MGRPRGRPRKDGQQPMQRAVPAVAIKLACGNCKFRLDTECHRMPPVARINIMDERVASLWPKVNATDWCGEYGQAIL